MPRWKVVVSLWLVAAVFAVVAVAFRRDRPSADAAAVTAARQAEPLACDVLFAARPLPRDVAETSGVARGIERTGVLWTHNDSGGEPRLFGVDETGRLVQRVRLAGATVVDWEDIEAAPCAGGACLYVADTGDNGGDREFITIYRIPEPGTGDAAVAAEPLAARYPDGQWDSEGLFLHEGRPYLVTKGRHGPLRLYGFPSALPTGGAATLELIAELGPEPEDGRDRVTAATASPDGRWVAIGTGGELRVYEAAPFARGELVEPRVFDLAPLGHEQTEAVALANDGRVWLTSEGGGGRGPVLSSLSCSL